MLAEKPFRMSGSIEPSEFDALAPAGYYVAVRVDFVFPMLQYYCLPAGWIQEYSVSSLVVHDPAMSWVYKNCGVARWSELGDSDTHGVHELAQNYGLDFGAVASCTDDDGVGLRTFGFFYRSDREYLADELERLGELLLACHLAHALPRNLTPAELETLSLVKNGLIVKEMVSVLGISESAIKQRLKNARLKLKAKTGAQAATTATMLGLI